MAWTKETLKAYHKHWVEFNEFSEKIDRKPLPASIDQIALYVTYIRQKKSLKATTIQSRLTAISHHHLMAGYNSPTHGYIVKSLITAYGNNDAPPATRRSITRDILADIILSINHTETGYKKRLYVAILCLMYHGLLRCSEVTHSSKCNHNLRASQVVLKKEPLIKIDFLSYKHSKPNPAPLYVKATQNSTCPVRALRRFKKVRPASSSTMFCHENRRPISRGQLVEVVRSHLDMCGRNSCEFNTHSLRMGKATDMLREGFTDRQIAVAGRWSSSAFLKYIKPNLVVV